MDYINISEPLFQPLSIYRQEPRKNRGWLVFWYYAIGNVEGMGFIAAAANITNICVNLYLRGYAWKFLMKVEAVIHPIFSEAAARSSSSCKIPPELRFNFLYCLVGPGNTHDPMRKTLTDFHRHKKCNLETLF